MLRQVAEHLRKMLTSFSEQDSLLFNNKMIKLQKENFAPIQETSTDKSVAFIDGGQAEIVSAGNFCLSFIRVAALVFVNNKKIKDYKHEFYLLTTARYNNQDLLYESKIFGDRLFDEQDLLISSQDSSIKTGIERAPISRVSGAARRFAELALAKKSDADIIVLDGTLEATFRNEEKYLDLPGQVCSVAKSSSLFTTSGNSPVVVLNRMGLPGCWSYFIEDDSYFVKLHPWSKHVFRFMGHKEVLSLLIGNSKDALFLGYPYGLIAADRFARVSNSERNNLRISFLLRKENKEISEYLSAMNAHEILDSMG